MDERLREQVRAARERADGESTLAAGHALARAGDPDGAAEMGALALRAGEPIHELLERLVPGGLSDFQERTIGVRFAQGQLDELAWTCDGRRLYATTWGQGNPLVLLERDSGAAHHLGSLPDLGMAIAVDPLGRVAVSTRNPNGPGSRVGLFDPNQGTVGKPLVATREEFVALSLLPWPDRIVVATPRSVRAYPLEDEAPRPQPVWAVGGERASLGPSGVVATGKGSLRLFDLGAREPRVKRAPAAPYDVQATGRGAVYVQRLRRREWCVTWLDPAGAVRAEHVLAERRLAGWTASPTGRYVLFNRPGPAILGSTTVVLLDLERGDTREVELSCLPSAFAWSPAGQTVAIGTSEGTIVFLDATAARHGETLPPSTTQQGPPGQVELIKRGRFWRITWDGQALTLHYGQQGRAGTRRRLEGLSVDEAVAEHTRRVAAKQRSGYRRR